MDIQNTIIMTNLYHNCYKQTRSSFLVACIVNMWRCCVCWVG